MIIKIIKDNKELHMEVNINMSVDEFKKNFLRLLEQNIEDYELYNSEKQKINCNFNELYVIYLKKKRK